jgi:tetratricopeptide (TPR) repeat protein
MVAGRFQEAVTGGQRLLERQVRVLGPKHHEVMNTLNNLGVAKARLGRSQEAVADLTRCLEGRRLIFPLDHPDTVQTEINLAMAHYALKNYAASAPLLEHVITVKRQSLPPRHRHLQELLNVQAFLCLRLQQGPAAEKHLQELLAIPEQEALGPKNRARQLIWLGMVLINQSRSAQGISSLVEGLNSLLQAPSLPPDFLEALQEGITALAQELRRQKREAEAQQWEERLRTKRTREEKSSQPSSKKP